MVDLHRSLTPPRFRSPLRFDSAWARRRTVRIAGTGVPTFGDEHLVMALCVQLAKDSWERRLRLAKVVDLAEVLCRRSALDWSWLLEEAASTGGLGLVAFGLTLAGGLLDAPVPVQVRRRLASGPDVGPLVDRAIADLFGPRQRPVLRSMRRFHGPLRERRRDRALAAIDGRHHVRWIRNRTVRAGARMLRRF